MSDMYDEAKARYIELMDTHLGIQVKGKANPYTSMNGNMFSFMDKAGRLCLRLSKADQAEFVAQFDTDPVQQYGAIMREYIEVPSQIFKDDAQLKPYLDLCKNYADSLPAKPTKR